MSKNCSVQILTLSADSPRHKPLTEQLDAAGIRWSLFIGVNGAELTAAQQQRLRPSLTRWLWGRPLNRGEAGCALSHLAAFEQAQADWLIFFENDAVLTNGGSHLQELLKLLDQVPADIDVLRFDVVPPKRLSSAQPLGKLGKFDLTWNARPVGRATGQAVRKSAAHRLARVNNRVLIPADDLLCYALKDSVVCAHVSPAPVIATDEDSEIGDLIRLSDRNRGVKKSLEKVLRTRTRVAWRVIKAFHRIRHRRRFERISAQLNAPTA